jgi:hypothetical protein
VPPRFFLIFFRADAQEVAAASRVRFQRAGGVKRCACVCACVRRSRRPRSRSARRPCPYITLHDITIIHYLHYLTLHCIASQSQLKTSVYDFTCVLSKAVKK